MAGSLNEHFHSELDKSRRLIAAMAADITLEAQVEAAVCSGVASLRAGGKILLAGNGGSAADAQHWAAELVGRFAHDRPSLAAIALTTDTSALTAIGNDYGYEHVFARQIDALGQPNDVLFAISTSGNSPNIVRAAERARAHGVKVIGFTGRSGGALAEGCDVCLRIPAEETSKIQEGHEIIGHLVCGLIEREMFPDGR